MKKTKGFTDFGNDFVMTWEVIGNKIYCRTKDNKPLVIEFSGDKITGLKHREVGGLKQRDVSSKRRRTKH